MAPGWGEIGNERAAIAENDGRIPRAWAEGFACLHPDRPPGDVPLRRWQQFVDDVGRFLDGPFCAVAAALGWGAYDLFGCDRDRPFARIDQAGLLWLLNGDKLIALTENTATIERRTGARQTYRRASRPSRVGYWRGNGALTGNDRNAACRELTKIVLGWRQANAAPSRAAPAREDLLLGRARRLGDFWPCRAQMAGAQPPK